MNQKTELDSIAQALTAAKNGVVFLPQDPTLDKVAASLSLFLSLAKAGKNFSISCSSPMTVDFSRLVGVDKISTKIQGGNLVVSLDYLESAIDKVSYNIENKKFNLVIQPKAGSSPLPSENVNFSYSGDLEVVIMVGVQSLENLGALYHQEKDVFQKEKIINIDLDSQNSRFGKTNAIVSGASSFSEIVASFLKLADLPLDQDIASNLLQGLEGATEGFSSSQTTPSAFEAAALCLRAGAQRPFREKNKENKKIIPIKKTEVQSSPTPDWYGPKVFRGSQHS